MSTCSRWTGAAVVSRRAKKEPPAQGGWNIFVTTSGGVGSANPVLHTWIGAACDKGLFGWPCDPKVEELRNAFGMAATEDERKKIAKELQTRAMEDVVFLPFGQWDTPLAYRADKHRRHRAQHRPGGAVGHHEEVTPSPCRHAPLPHGEWRGPEGT